MDFIVANVLERRRKEIFLYKNGNLTPKKIVLDEPLAVTN
jgi:hypothetical protein